MFSTQQIKQRSVKIMSEANPNPTLIFLIYFALSLVISYLSARLIGIRMTETELQMFQDRYLSLDYGWLMDFITKKLSSVKPAAYIINIALQIGAMILSAGWTMFVLHTMRADGEAARGNLLDGFAIPFRVLALTLLEGLFVFLWSLLLIVPGLIAAYKYRLALYLLIDRPDLSPMQCILESKRLMSGHKARLFELDFSFLLWYLLMCLPIIGYAVQVWVLPQIDVCRAVFYENRLAMERVEAARAAARTAASAPTGTGTVSEPEDRNDGENQ